MLGAILLWAIAIQAPSPAPVQLTDAKLPDSALAARPTAAPVAARQAVYEALYANDVTRAEALAEAYASARGDSLLVEEVARFSGRSPSDRAAWRAADSLRRAGIAAMGRDGAAAALAIWRRALRRARAIDDTALAAAVSGNIGEAFRRLDQLDSAAAYFTRAWLQARAIGDRRVQANALTGLGAVNDQRGDLAGARTRYGQALELHEQLGDTRGLAADRNNLGMLAWSAGDLPEARREFEAALELNRGEGRDELVATNMVNLAGVASLEGRFATAERLYRDALATWRTQDAWADAADAALGIGELEVRRGDYPAARGALEEALGILERTGPVAAELRARTALAGVLAAEGRMQEARDALRKAEHRIGTGSPVLQAQLAVARADLDVQLNAYAAAERGYQRAARLYREAADPVGEASAQHGRGMLMLVRGDLAGAERALDAARRIQQAHGDRRGAGVTRLAQGEAARARGDTALARQRFQQSASELARVHDPVGEAAALGGLAAVAADRDQPASAESLYGQALARLQGRPAPDLAWRLHVGLARARASRAAIADALTALRLAVAEIERSGSSLRLPERRAGFWEDKWDVYAKLALLERSAGNDAAAFQASERLRAREMLELLGHGRIDDPGDALAAREAEREQDLRLLIAQLTSELETAPAGPLRGRTPMVEGGAVREALLAAQAAYADFMLDLRERAPQHAALVAPPPAAWRDVALRLRVGEALVEYLVGDEGSVAFLVTRDTLAVVDLGIGRHELARLVEFARGTVETGQASLDSLWRGPFRRLHRHLLAPVEETGLLAGIQRLIIVPHAELHYLPFAALLEGDRPLVLRYELATTPSATAWLAMGDRPEARGMAGMLAMAPRPRELPGSAAELGSVRRFAREPVDVLSGDSASEAAFRAAAPRSRVLHLATFGVLNRQNPLFSFVDLAPGGGQDGRLEVHEVFGLALSADLVVLSACETGLGSGRLADVPRGDDWVGLTRAFLHAGARAVVATLWPVDDRATAALMDEFYRAQGDGRSPGEALARAQRALLSTRETAHPFFWAGATMVEGRPR